MINNLHGLSEAECTPLEKITIGLIEALNENILTHIDGKFNRVMIEVLIVSAVTNLLINVLYQQHKRIPGVDILKIFDENFKNIREELKRQILND